MDTNEVELCEGDYILSPCGRLGGRIGVGIVGGRFLRDFAETDEALQFIRERMDAESFWPGVWFESDHGNLWAVDPTTGREVQN